MLDRMEPGWRDRISPAELDMRNCSRCVIGQVLGLDEFRYHAELSHWFGVHPLTGLDRCDAFLKAEREHGFAAADVESDPAWDALRDAWIGYVKGEWS